MKQIKHDGKAVSYVLNSYLAIEPWRRNSDDFLHHVKEMPQSGWTAFGTNYYLTKPHKNPLVYVGPWIHYICALTDKYLLDISEVASLLLAAVTQAYMPYYFLHVAV